MRGRLPYPDVFGFLTIPVWVVVLEASHWANTHAFQSRATVLLVLGVALVALLILNIAAFISGMQAFRAKPTVRNILGIVLNAFQAAGIIILVVVGTFLNARG